VENALIKARAACASSGLPAIADDSGLEVDALGGLPGVRSARYAGDTADDTANNAKLLAALDGLPAARRAARFRSVVVYLRHALDPAPIITEGVWRGRILCQPRGEGGFGYDPLFLDPVQDSSAAQMSPMEKNRLSHRGIAMRALCARLREEWAARDDS
ncbi:MAG: non-canonical purine NTP pyrophosphatase, partial [Gammaproteobacteria bacterium]|nr:non-canonical purine NTP pyrophosphatase [Gammaproteobacteria bacterium]